MSSREFQQAKRVQKVKPIESKQYKDQTNQKKQNLRPINNVDAFRTKNLLNNQISQPASTFVSRRELNQNSMVFAKEQNQLPVRGKVYWPDRNQKNQIKKVVKYEYKSKNNPNQNKKNARNIISSVGKTDNQRYNSVEQQKVFQNRYQSYESPLKKRSGFAAKLNNSNFNKKRWAYASKQDINKLIALQRWWRYILKNPKFRKKNRFSQSNTKNLGKRSQSTKFRKSLDMAKFMKQGENITEKIFPGKNNDLIIETRKVEVFKINRPKPKKTAIKSESIQSKKYDEGIELKQKHSSDLIGETGDFTKNIYKGKYNTLTADNRKGIKIGDTKQKYEFIRKEGENITEKIFPGKNNTLINEKRTVEVFKVNKPKAREGVRISSQESERHAQSLKTSEQKYQDKRKHEGNIVDRYPGQDNKYLITEKRKVDIYKKDKPKSKQDIDKDLREKGKYPEGSKELGRYTDSTGRKKLEKSEEKTYPGKIGFSTEERRRDGSRIDSREKGKYKEGVTDSKKYGDQIYSGKTGFSTEERRRDGSRIDSKEKDKYKEGVSDLKKYGDQIYSGKTGLSTEERRRDGSRID